MSTTRITGIVPLRRIYGASDESSKGELNELLQTFYEFYKVIEHDYKGEVEEEMKTKVLPMCRTESEEGDNVHVRNLKMKGHSMPAMRWSDDEDDVEVADEHCQLVSQVLAPDGTPMFPPRKLPASKCIRIEDTPLEKTTKMSFYLPVQNNIETEDREQLSHLRVNDATEVMQKRIYASFPGGIHGAAKQDLVSSRQIVYKMLRKCLENRAATMVPQNPDLIYYAMYRMFPQSGTQHEYSTMFPDLCDCFAEAGFDSWELEPWKTKPAPKVAENLRSGECIDCLSYVCAVHGFRAEIPEVFRSGNFLDIGLPIPSNPSDCDDCPCPPCWKTTPMDHVIKMLMPTEAELVTGVVTAYIDTHDLAGKPINPENMMLSYMEALSQQTFCNYSALFIGEHDAKMKSCADAYKIVLETVVFPDKAIREIGVAKPLKPYGERLRAWSNCKRQQAKEEMRKKEAELAKKAKKQGRSLDDLKAEEAAKAAHGKHVPFRMVQPFRPCHHAGPCGISDDCSCKANGTCFPTCRCDTDCPQRFPGCECGPGKCSGQKCQCYLAQVECSPATCRSCNCGDVDSEYGLVNSCQNFGMTRMVTKMVQVRKSTIPKAGNGLFVLEKVTKNELIIEYVGEKISDKEVERRGVIEDSKKCSYIFNLLGGGGIDGAKIGNESRFANHNDVNPNVFAKNVIVGGEARIGLYAKRNLEVGEELTFDYGYSPEQREHYFGAKKQ